MSSAMKTVRCEECGKMHERRSNNQKYCIKCAPEMRRRWLGTWMKEWRAVNSAALKEYGRKYKAEHRERYGTNMKKYRAENRERLREYMRKYQEENHEKLLRAWAEYREKNRERLREYNRKKHAQNRRLIKYAESILKQTGVEL